MIGALTTYVIIIEPIISVWAIREIARGEKSGKTAIVTSGMFSIIGISAYIVIAYFVGMQVNAEINLILFSVILIPLLFLSRTLSVVNMGWKPQAASYGLISFEISKIPAGLVFVYFLDMGLEGAIIATVAAYSINIVVLLYHGKEKILVPFKKEFLIKWLKLSWLALYTGRVYSMIQHFDVAVFSLIVGNVMGLSYWSAAFAISTVVAQSSAVSQGLYGKLLGGNEKEYFRENFRLVLYFIIPLFAFAITFARPGLFTLNPVYEIAVTVVIFLSVHMLVQTFNNIFDAALKGIEKVDLNEKAKLKDYIKSRLFYLPTLTIIQRISYITTLALILFLTLDESDLNLVINWSIVAALIPIPFMFYRLILMKKNFNMKISYYIISKYIITAIVIFGITAILMEEYLIYHEQIMLFLPQVLLYIIFSVGGYIGITFLIDSNTKQLVKAIFSELKSIKK